MDTKNILYSKTFWFNIGTLLVTLGGVLDPTLLDPKYALIVLTLGNIILRMVTTTGVTVLPGKKNESSS